MSEQFINLIPRMLPHAHETLTYVMGRFQPAEYAPELYLRHGLAYPPNIAKSVTKRQAEYLAGRLCARSILAEHGYHQFDVATGKHREPIWPQGIVGSITHHGKLAAAICYPDCNILGIGIDLADVVDAGAGDALLQLVVSASELALLRSSVDELGLHHLLTLVFSVKESFFKAAFPQVREYFGFDAVQVIHVDAAAGRIAFRCATTLSARLLQGSVHTAHFEWVGADTLLTAVVLNR